MNTLSNDELEEALRAARDKTAGKPAPPLPVEVTPAARPASDEDPYAEDAPMSSEDEDLYAFAEDSDPLNDPAAWPEVMPDPVVTTPSAPGDPADVMGEQDDIAAEMFGEGGPVMDPFGPRTPDPRVDAGMDEAYRRAEALPGVTEGTELPSTERTNTVSLEGYGFERPINEVSLEGYGLEEPLNAPRTAAVAPGLEDPLAGYDMSALDALNDPSIAGFEPAGPEAAAAEPVNEVSLEGYGFEEPMELAEGPNAEIYGSATDEDPVLAGAPGAVMPSIDDESGFWGMATDEDPELPGSAYPADDNEAVEASLGIDDDEAAEEGGGMALADPRMPPEASGALEASAGAKVPTEPGSDPLALDYGLPTEGAIGNERGWDVLRQITGRLGNAFRVAGGGSHRDIETVAPGMEETRREGLAERLGAKAASAEGDRRATRDAELAEGVARARREPTELELSREARMAADSARDDDLTGRRLDLTERGLDDRAASSDADRATAEAMGNPESDVSAQARERLGIAMEGLPPTLRAAIGTHNLEGMSANDVAALEDSIRDFSRGMLGRGRGGGGGGGASPTHDALRGALLERGLGEEEADAILGSMGNRRVATTVLSDALGRGRMEATADRRVEDRDRGALLIEGVHATVPMSEPARRAWQTGWSTTRGSMGAMRRIGEIADEYGAATVINPAIRARLETNMFPLRSMIAQLQGTGVINPSEMARIDAALPDATSMIGMSVGSFRARLAEWRTLVEEGVRFRMTDMGVPEAEVGRAMRALTAGSRIVPGGRRAASSDGAEGEAPTGDTVRVRLANGRTANLPRDVYEAHRDEVEVIDGP